MQTIKFKPKGRPAKAGKLLEKKINELISSLPKEKTLDLDIPSEVETVAELDALWVGLSPLEKFTAPEPEPKPAPESQPPPPSQEKIQVTDTHKTNPRIMSQGGSVEETQEEVVQTPPAPAAPSPTPPTPPEPSPAASTPPLRFNPLGKSVEERSYNKQQVVYNDVIPEPEFKGHISAEDLNPPSPIEETTPEPPKEKPLDNLRNPALEDLDPKDKKIASDQLVETALDAYESAHQLGAKFAKINVDKLKQAQAKGEINLSMELSMDPEGHKTITPLEFIEGTNEAIDEILTPDPEFREKMTPILQRIFVKKGWGLTDEQRAAALITQDAGTKVALVIGMRKQNSEMMKMFKDMHEQNLAAAVNESPPIGPDTITHPASTANVEPPPNPDDSVHQEPIVDNEAAPDSVENALEVQE